MPAPGDGVPGAGGPLLAVLPITYRALRGAIRQGDRAWAARPMDRATQALLDLWDVAGDAVANLRADDWSRPTPGPEADVGGLVAHLAGIHYAGPETLRASLGAARRRDALQLAGRVPGDRVLGAHCLDLCVHAHDLTTALDAPVDLADHAAAALEACRLIVDVAPRLLVAVSGPRDATVRLVVRHPG